MGCKSTNLNERPRFAFDTVTCTTPFLKKVKRLYKSKSFELMEGNYKDILKTEDAVYAIEKIKPVQKYRRRRLYAKLVEANINVVIPTHIEYIEMSDAILSVSSMDLFETDLFDYLANRTVDLKQFVSQISRTVQSIHQVGIYCIDFKPENILLNSNMVFYIADLESALMKTDFVHPNILRRQRWVRTKGYDPGFGKPRNVEEAMRNDLYAMSLTIGRMEAYYTHKREYGVFTIPRCGMMPEGYDDRYRIPAEYKYSTFCAQFMVRDMMYTELLKFYHSYLISL